MEKISLCIIVRDEEPILEKFLSSVKEYMEEIVIVDTGSKDKTKEIGKTGIIIEHRPELSKEKQEYYLKLLKIKKEKFPESSADKEMANETFLFNPR